MKNQIVLLFITFFLGSISLFAQVPEAFNYQAVARASDGTVMANESITIRVDIGGDPIEGLGTEFSEEHSVSTNASGLFSAVLGTGQNQMGSLASVSWAEGSKFISVSAMDGSGAFSALGTSQLVSVPYALMAGTTAGESGAGAMDELQQLSHTGDSIVLSQNGGSVPDRTDDADADPTNELQQISLADNVLTLSEDGGSVTLPDMGDPGDEDKDPGNEIQTLSKDGLNIILSDGGGSIPDAVDDADADDQNEIQELSIDANELSLSNGGGSVSLPAGETQMLSKDGLSIILSNGGGTIPDAVDDADADDQNEIQELSISENELRLSNGGGTVTLPDVGDPDDEDKDPGNEIQTLSKDGLNIILSDGGGTIPDAVNDADADDQNEIQELSINENELRLSNGGGTITLPAGGSSPWTENGNEVSYPGTVSTNGDKATLFTTGNGNGEIRTFGANGQTNVILGQSYTNQGAIALRNASNTTNVRAGAISDAGFVDVFGTNGTINAQIGSDSRDRRCGAIHAFDHQGTRRASLYGCIIIERQSAEGAPTTPIAASAVVNDLKMCKMDHPTKPGSEIWLTAMEGPEAGTYLRGQIKLVDGKANVEYPDHFLHTANVSGATIMLTPHSGESLGLAATERTETGFSIQELGRGEGSYTVDWEIKTVRKGFEEMPVVREKVVAQTGLIGLDE